MKTKVPEKTPPAAMATTNGNADAAAPTVQIADSLKSSFEELSNAPKLNPPEKAEAFSSFGAAVWSSDKRVNGLYTTYHARNSWMGIAGVGWKKLATGSDAMCEAMTLLAAHCREKNCRIDFAEENGLIKEMYIW